MALLPARRHPALRPARPALGLILLALLALPGGAQAAGPQPGSLEYLQRDNQNQRDAYGRNTDQQLGNPAYMQALAADHGEAFVNQLAAQAATPTRLAITPGNVFPGWNAGNPFRRGWSGSRGLSMPVKYTNRYGALIRGHVYAPLPGARDPYTHRRLRRPYPGVVITTGSIQGSEGMYVWLAEDLAERGYLVMTYDVQGQGTSETFPHENEQVDAVPFCNPFAPAAPGEDFGCPGVPAQQDSNFIYGTRDALSFFLSTPRRRYHEVFNPLWKLFDRSRDRRTKTRGRTRRIAIIGHSLGASAVSYVQGTDKRVEAVVALDKLRGPGADSGIPGPDTKPVVPALAVQSEYGFNTQPYFMQHGTSFQGRPGPPNEAPDPRREQKTGFDGWKAAGKDSMLIVPRASTHLEYTDIALALPASRYGQAFTSVYVQRWLGRYMKHRSGNLLAPRFRYLEPVDVGRWAPITLNRADRLSFYFCSAYSLGRRAGEWCP